MCMGIEDKDNAWPYDSNNAKFDDSVNNNIFL